MALNKLSISELMAKAKRKRKVARYQVNDPDVFYGESQVVPRESTRVSTQYGFPEVFPEAPMSRTPDTPPDLQFPAEINQPVSGADAMRIYDQMGAFLARGPIGGPIGDTLSQDEFGVGAPDPIDPVTIETVQVTAPRVRDIGGEPYRQFPYKYRKYKGKYDTLVNKYAEKYNLDPNLLAAVIKTESGFNPEATSSAGAKGLMQIMPITAKEMGITSKERTDPIYSIAAGAKLLARLINEWSHLPTYKQQVEAALRSYNMGKAGYSKVLRGEKKLPKETRNYDKKVMRNYKDFTKRKFPTNLEDAYDRMTTNEQIDQAVKFSGSQDQFLDNARTIFNNSRVRRMMEAQELYKARLAAQPTIFESMNMVERKHGGRLPIPRYQSNTGEIFYAPDYSSQAYSTNVVPQRRQDWQLFGEELDTDKIAEDAAIMKEIASRPKNPNFRVSDKIVTEPVFVPRESTQTRLAPKLSTISKVPLPVARPITIQDPSVMQQDALTPRVTREEIARKEAAEEAYRQGRIPKVGPGKDMTMYERHIVDPVRMAAYQTLGKTDFDTMSALSDITGLSNLVNIPVSGYRFGMDPSLATAGEFGIDVLAGAPVAGTIGKGARMLKAPVSNTMKGLIPTSPGMYTSAADVNPFLRNSSTFQIPDIRSASYPNKKWRPLSKDLENLPSDELLDYARKDFKDNLKYAMEELNALKSAYKSIKNMKGDKDGMWRMWLEDRGIKGVPKGRGEEIAEKYIMGVEQQLFSTEKWIDDLIANPLLRKEAIGSPMLTKEGLEAQSYWKTLLDDPEFMNRYSKLGLKKKGLDDMKSAIADPVYAYPEKAWGQIYYGPNKKLSLISQRPNYGGVNIELPNRLRSESYYLIDKSVPEWRNSAFGIAAHEGGHKARIGLPKGKRWLEHKSIQKVRKKIYKDKDLKNNKGIEFDDSTFAGLDEKTIMAEKWTDIQRVKAMAWRKYGIDPMSKYTDFEVQQIAMDPTLMSGYIRGINDVKAAKKIFNRYVFIPAVGASAGYGISQQPQTGMSF